MTDAYWLDLGKRAVACKAWRWRGGMRMLNGTDGKPVVLGSGDRIGDDSWTDEQPNADCISGEPLPGTYRWSPPSGTIPDLRDPATMGCLLALVREAWGKLAYVEPRWGFNPMHWEVYVRGDDKALRYGDTEAEALVAALEASP